MTFKPIKRTIANVLLLCGAILLLIGTLTVLGSTLNHTPLLLPADTLFAGVVLVLAGSALLRNGAIALEVLLSAVGLPLLLFGTGLALRALEGKPVSVALAAAMIVVGLAACYQARQLMRRRVRPTHSNPQG
jgi:hypothetical protein